MELQLFMQSLHNEVNGLKMGFPHFPIRRGGGILSCKRAREYRSTSILEQGMAGEAAALTFLLRPLKNTLVCHPSTSHFFLQRQFFFQFLHFLFHVCLNKDCIIGYCHFSQLSVNEKVSAHNARFFYLLQGRITSPPNSDFGFGCESFVLCSYPNVRIQI